MIALQSRRAVLAVLATALAAPLTAGQTLSLSPAVVTLGGHPGQGTHQVLTLANGTSLPLEFELQARDVVVRDGKRVMVRAGELADSIAASAVFAPRRIKVAPGESRAVEVTLTLPPAVSYRAVAVMFKGLTRIKGDRRAAATVSLGTLITFSLSDSVAVSASALGVRPQSAASNLRFEQDFVNSGSEPMVLRGLTVVVDAQGTMVGKVPSRPQRLLPGERAAVRSEYGGELAAGRYRALSTFEFEGHALTRTAEFVVR